MSLSKKLVVPPGGKTRIADFDPADPLAGVAGAPTTKDEAEAALSANVEVIADLQYRLYAENTRALLIVLQAMDAAGKDGVIRHCFSGVNPQGCKVTAFKQPSATELDHGYLWRIHHAVPPKGEIGIFNRSHYEDVIVVRVHELVPEKVWKARYDQINAFERLLADNGVVIRKFFLNVSNAEQKKRLLDRLADPKKNWKMSAADFAERRRWPEYMAAYEDAVARCSTDHAPWHVIPADRKWIRNWAVSQIVRETLESMDPKLPKIRLDPATIDTSG
ncbi:MAG: polyphosphate kinase 2 family protein [Phycisphaerales bacterium]|nr:polyphosphate kinase 2 family protein [Phycisphaerales bacterium]